MLLLLLLLADACELLTHHSQQPQHHVAVTALNTYTAALCVSESGLWLATTALAREQISAMN
jgi:hypothetical protein